jgi:amino acid adenylation domain-containing protein
LWVHYEAVRKGIPSPLSELTVQFSDYATWQREILLEEHLAYWREQLDGLIPLDVPTARTRPPVQTFRGAFHALCIPRALTHGLKTLGRREGCTLYMVLLAAFKTLLWRCSHQDDLAVGTIDAGRSRPELEPLLGYFLNMLVIRTDLSRNPTFREFLHQVRQVALEAYEHKDLPFIMLVEALKPPRDAARHPLFQVAFFMQPTFPAQESGWTVSQLEVQTGTSKFDLTLELEEREEQIIGRFEYDTALFDSAAIERMAGHYQKILEGIVANPDRRLSELSLLTDSEQQQLLVEWNNTGADYPRDKCIHELFEAQVEKTPDATAVVFGDQRLTYKQLNERANRLAHHLQLLGVSADVRVGICLERSLEMLVGLLGILKAGGAYIPLDPVYPSDRLAFMLEDAGPPVLLTQRKLQGNLPPHNSLVICIDDFDLRMGEEIAPSAGARRRSNLAYILYTSGSTGKPKGVQIPHRAVVNFLTAMRKQLGMTDADTLLAVTTLSFDIAVLELFLPLTIGASIVLARREIATDGERLSLLLDEAKVTVMQATPVTWQMLIESGWQGSQTLTILCGGEALHQDLADQLVSRSASVWNLYGPTETTIWSSIFRVQAGQPVTIGRPIANTRFYILDQYLHMVPIGVPGELFISGDCLARGYLNRPDLTDEKFIPNPFSHEPGALMYCTGDMARYLPDGNIEFMGRIDLQVKIRGFRIELGEIETVLRQHPAVRETAVIAQEDRRGDKRLVAYVVFNQRATILTSESRSFLKEKLPDYMVPSAFVSLDVLPLTLNGKVDRKALSVHDPERSGLEDSFVAPRTPIEEVLAGIWCEVLGLKKVGINDNFFELGGHSLLATQVMSRLRNAFQVEIPLRILFETPTVAGLAMALLQKAGKREKLEKKAALLLKVAELSEDEVNTMLEERIRERHNNTNE